jgi:hypothetical protein
VSGSPRLRAHTLGLAVLLAAAAAVPVSGAAQAVAAEQAGQHWKHVSTVRLGADVFPSQVVADGAHHRVYVDSVGNLEVVDTRTMRVLGRPIDEAVFRGLVPDLRHNRVYVLPSGANPQQPFIRVMRGDRELARVRLNLRVPQAPIFSAVVDPKTGWLYVDMTSDADLPSSLWVINGGRLMAKIPTGIQSVPSLPLALDAATGDVDVPEVERSRSGGGPESLITADRSR